MCTLLTYQKQTKNKIILLCSLKEQKCIIFLVNYRCGNFTKLPCETYYKLDIWVSKFSHHNSISLSICLLLYIVSSSYLFIIQMKSEIDFGFYISFERKLKYLVWIVRLWFVRNLKKENLFYASKKFEIMWQIFFRCLYIYIYSRDCIIHLFV